MQFAQTHKRKVLVRIVELFNISQTLVEQESIQDMLHTQCYANSYTPENDKLLVLLQIE